MWGTMTAGNYRPGKRRKQNIYKGKKLIKIYDVNSARTFQNFHKGLKVNLTGSDRIWQDKGSTVCSKLLFNRCGS